MSENDEIRSDQGANPADVTPESAASNTEAALRAAQLSVDKVAQESHSSPAVGGAEAEQALAAARATAREAQGEAARAVGGSTPFVPGSVLEAFAVPTFADAGFRQTPDELQLLSDVNLNVKIELGRTRMLVEDVLRLGEGAVVELDKLAGDPVDVYINDRHVARGEVLVLNESFCVRISEILSLDEKVVAKRA
ncbi:MAG: flagellar motor switch protein FliN [Phycisphaeraceae bacterium]|nr:flagellar motor switch protein FliN [Phycisphaeraceae bacterium]MCW5762604.1 flagellar motor switch protein FliN [Phycisphaeraceae bacterium]